MKRFQIIAKAGILVLLKATIATGVRSFDERLEPPNFTNINTMDTVNLAPLFENHFHFDGNEPTYVYPFGATILKCCCKGNDCVLGDSIAPNVCTGKTNPWMSFRDSKGCGCIVGVGYRSYQKADNGQVCTMTIDMASQALTKFHPRRFRTSPSDIMQRLQNAETTRYIGSYKISYSECDSSCGKGRRSKLEEYCMTTSCPPLDEQTQAPSHIDCIEYKGCEWICDHGGLCGWGSVRCSNPDESYCQFKSVRELAFPMKDEYMFEKCFKECPKEESLTSMCAVTANHLDQQYGSVQSLMNKTCFSNIKKKNRPDVVVLMAQELNHYNKAKMGTNDFPMYVERSVLSGYELAAVCAPDMSANSAVYIKKHHGHHIFPSKATCSNTELRSTCDWTNCKGSTVMEFPTSSGMLVVGNWHGARAGTESPERVREFEMAVAAIQSIPNTRKFVVFGGDVNVRSTFKQLPSLDLRHVFFPEDIINMIDGDILGVPGWTVDQHLRGEVGYNTTVMQGLRNFPLKQARGWNKLCPTYRKQRAQDYIQGDEIAPFLKCRSWDDFDTVEYLDMIPSGKKSRAPSWTERIFLSEALFNGCGPAQKDIRNLQTDHDPMFVQCSIPR